MPDYTIDPHAEHARMGAIYDELKTLTESSTAEDLGQQAQEVSAWTVGQQIEHTLIASGMMLKAPRAIHLGRGQAEEGPNRIGVMVMRTERVRRGKAKAPDLTVPTASPSHEVLHQTWTRSKRAHDAVAPLLPDLSTTARRLEHPYLGWLNAVEWLRIVRVHAEHHLRLIAEIQAAAA